LIPPLYFCVSWLTVPISESVTNPIPGIEPLRPNLFAAMLKCHRTIVTHIRREKPNGSGVDSELMNLK